MALFLLIMRKITGIEAQKKNSDRVSIFLEGSYAFGLSKMVAAWLTVGQSLSEEKIEALQADDTREVAMQRALNFLSYRARSEQEIRANLTRAEIPDVVLEATLQRLRELNLVNDADFARMWIEGRKQFRPRSRRFLAYELRLKGIDEQVAQDALEDQVVDEVEALNAGRKIARRLATLDFQDFRAKLGGYLGRRGFSYQAIAPALRQLWDELHPDGEISNFDDEENL
jgi:regulatory protein